MTESNLPGELDIYEILKLLPHRYPFVMVDRITSIFPGREITGIKNVTMNEPFFQGHFPDQPVMPGVMILEGMAQVGGVLGFHTKPEYIGNKLLYFAGIDNARFRKPVIPGDQLIFELKLLKMKRGIMVMDGKAYVSGQLVAQAELMASFG
ncbi:MAG: 3-hydroxyacyl-ACP dehydratase FabZ [Desulfopila sp.]|jgi:3-hydroxyacyl-[acyl-carrier-protein] dehydratase|nr:3-hydroxyacyl-ACP dehydratase FabZ [Desulfopila sp.]